MSEISANNVESKSFLNSVNTSSEYVRSLEMAVQLLQREVDHLRSQAVKPKAVDSNSNIANSEYYNNLSTLFSRCDIARDVFITLDPQISDTFEIIEYNIFFFTAKQKLYPVDERDTNVNLSAIAVHLEEQGIIDWAFEMGEPCVIPNLAEPELKTINFLIIIPIELRGINVGIFLAKTFKNKDSINFNELESLRTIAEAAAVALDNIKSSEEIKQMNMKLAGLNSQMLQSSKMASIGEIAGSISKEIDTPLKVLLGHLKLLQSGVGDQKRRIKVIVEQANKIDEINTRLSDLSVSANSEKSSEPIDLVSIIDEVLLFSGAQLMRDGIRVELEYQPDNYYINGFKPQLEQVFLSLLLHSRDSMPDGGIINIMIFESSGKINVTLTDDGTGYEQEVLNHIFEPLFFPKSEERRIGSELYMIKNIIMQHNGLISIASELGKGTKFKIVFKKALPIRYLEN
ncbi:MAG: ATP-binding protein [Candidatus Kapabacteria bacterium]|nr:ATP-binding protein [Candidatus Kapabacteria bacterium]